MPPCAGERRILIVEDEKVVAETLGQILRVHGYSVRIAHSAEEALDVISLWSPHLAILDVMLPKMNGIQLAMVLKDQIRDCGILLFSGQPSVEDLIAQARLDGLQFDILAKPVHPSVMLDTVSTLLTPTWGSYFTA